MVELILIRSAVWGYRTASKCVRTNRNQINQPDIYLFLSRSLQVYVLKEITPCQDMLTLCEKLGIPNRSL